MSLVVDNGREKTRHHRKLKEDNKEVFIKEKEKEGERGLPQNEDYNTLKWICRWLFERFKCFAV